MACNVVYAHLIAGCQSTEDREKFDSELHGDAVSMSLVDQIGG